MNEYPSKYLQSHDIDWFYVINGIPIHFASAGGIIPNAVNNREKLRLTQCKVNKLPCVLNDTDIQINPNLYEQFEDEQALNEYLNSFNAMAKKGFVSYDRTDIQDPTSSVYIYVCGPKNYLPNNSVMEVLKNTPHIDVRDIDMLNPLQIIDISKI